MIVACRQCQQQTELGVSTGYGHNFSHLKLVLISIVGLVFHLFGQQTCAWFKAFCMSSKLNPITEKNLLYTQCPYQTKYILSKYSVKYHSINNIQQNVFFPKNKPLSYILPFV